MYEAQTLPDFKRKLRGYEFLQTYENNYNANKNNCDGKEERKPVCFLCGDYSHRAPSCPHKSKGPKCFKCGQFGHTSTCCVENIQTIGRMNIMSGAGMSNRENELNDRVNEVTQENDEIAEPSAGMSRDEFRRRANRCLYGPYDSDS